MNFIIPIYSYITPFYFKIAINKWVEWPPKHEDDQIEFVGFNLE